MIHDMFCSLVYSESFLVKKFVVLGAFWSIFKFDFDNQKLCFYRELPKKSLFWNRGKNIIDIEQRLSEELA